MICEPVNFCAKQGVLSEKVSTCFSAVATVMFASWKFTLVLWSVSSLLPFFSYFPFSSRVNKCNPSAPGCEHVSHSPILFRHTLGIIWTHSTRPQRVGPYWKIHRLFSTGDHSFTCTITGKTICLVHILDTSWKPSASCSKCQQPTSSTHLGVGISCTYVTDEPKSQKGVQDKQNNKLLWAFPPHFLTMLY